MHSHVPEMFAKNDAHLCIDMEQALAIVRGASPVAVLADVCCKNLAERVDHANELMRMQTGASLLRGFAAAPPPDDVPEAITPKPPASPFVGWSDKTEGHAAITIPLPAEAPSDEERQASICFVPSRAASRQSSGQPPPLKL
eukprot:TRINITY_DN11500_c0_g1_i1.p2 TRINITY_DN11500_c0_g1~~TRINITY_DN11500_c0_g1_i1.p2  ORF type:complete len:142 (-),score=39.95 TRINITY_DN11500_c0_g1_i1:124-549(-)